jgi:ubiquinone/menaquinone biosynthesis C-methylase UbiE
MATTKELQQVRTALSMSDESPMFGRAYDAIMALPEWTVLEAHRRFLAEGLAGRVVDLGAGTGAQFPAYAEYGGEITALYAVEPDPAMRERARDRAAEVDFPIELVDATGESLPFADGSIDAVVASLVFCTIPDAEDAFDEVARVLRPGGEFRFLEHVRATGGLGGVHDLLTPCWRPVAGGCHLNRKTGDMFRSDDRFELLEYDRFESGLMRALPLIRGSLQRRADPGLLSRLVLTGG